MLRRVSSPESNYTNSGQITSSSVHSTGRLMWAPLLSPHLMLTQYSVIIACLHQCLSIVFVPRTQHSANWTAGHIDPPTLVNPLPAPVYSSFLYSPSRFQPTTTVMNVETRLKSSTLLATPNSLHNSHWKGGSNLF